MIPENIRNLIRTLTEKTNAKQAIWGKTSRPNEFKFFFEKGAITSDSWSDNNGIFADFAIFNDDGQQIDYHQAKAGGAEYQLLLDLNNAAKREFYKVEETISNLITELDSTKKIGKREIEGSSDLPF